MITPTTHARRAAFAAVLFTTLGLCAAALAADWPQYRGPKHDQTSVEPIRTDWQQQAPKVAWKVPLGESFGSFAVRGDRAYVFVRNGNEEACVGLEAASGKELWTRTIDKTIFDRQGGNGPRTTPSLDGDRVYVLGTYFKLACLNAADGTVVWARDLAKEHQAQNDTNGIVQWGNSMSPVVEGDLVIVAGGGRGQTFMAFDKNTGSVVWKAGNERVTHSTATPATIGGQRQIIFFVQAGLVSLEPKTGRELWRYKFPFNVSTAASPVVGGKNGDVVYCAAGYNVGAAAVRVTKEGDKWAARELWREKGNKFANHWSTPVHHDGHVYGLYGHNTRATAPLECHDIETGELKWSEQGFGTGGGLILLGGKHLVVQHDTGPISLVEPSPQSFKRIAQIQPLTGKAWTMPIVADGKMYVRTDKEGACLDVAGK